MLNVHFGTYATPRVRFGDLDIFSESSRQKAEAFLKTLHPDIWDKDLHQKLTSHIGPTFLPIRDLDEYKALQSIAQSRGRYADETVKMAQRCMLRLNNYYAPPGDDFGFGDD